jgi:uncharacterized membrane protein YphA (DoxX/SURF4 family)
MNKSRKILGWVFTILAVIAPTWGVIGKFTNEGMQANMASIGFKELISVVAIGELIAIVLFIIPKTGRIGTILMTMLMSGAIAAHLGHDQSIGLQTSVIILVWIAAIIRYPDFLKLEA